MNSRCVRTARLTMIATHGSCHPPARTPHSLSRTNSLERAGVSESGGASRFTQAGTDGPSYPRSAHQSSHDSTDARRVVHMLTAEVPHRISRASPISSSATETRLGVGPVGPQRSNALGLPDNTAADHIQATKMALAQLPKTYRRGRQTLIRTGSGSSSHEFVARLAKPGRWLSYHKAVLRVPASSPDTGRRTGLRDPRRLLGRRTRGRLPEGQATRPSW